MHMPLAIAQGTSDPIAKMSDPEDETMYDECIWYLPWEKIKLVVGDTATDDGRHICHLHAKPEGYDDPVSSEDGT